MVHLCAQIPDSACFCTFYPARQKFLDVARFFGIENGLTAVNRG